MKQIVFQIRRQKKIVLDFSIKTTRKYPIHTHYLLEDEKKTVIYKYEPASSLNETAYLKYLKNYLSEKYNTNLISVSVEEII